MRNDPLESVLNIIYGKWKIRIICSLLQRPKYFGELRRSIGNVSQKVLTENLRSLEKDGLVLRIIQNNDISQVKYALTKNGYNMIPVIDEMVRWGRTYGKVVPAKKQDESS